MRHNMNKTYIKYAAFNVIIREHYMCNSKTLLAKHIGTSTRTILRKELMDSNFIINDWYISTNVELHKQPVRNKG